MTLVAISAAYGAAGSRVGPALAQRLGVPFVDRAVPLAVAERLAVGVEEADTFDERASASLLQRMLHGFIGADTGVPAAPAPDLLSEDDFRIATEQVLRAQASTGEGVILGRGAVYVLRDDPAALRVRLDGPPERRVEQAMRMQGIDRHTAEAGMRRIDRAHAAYVRQFYGVRIDDPAQYHLVLDSTWLSVETCVELIAVAAEARDRISHP
jgi:cytidylate kinase